MQLVDLGEQGVHEFPDDASPEEIKSAVIGLDVSRAAQESQRELKKDALLGVGEAAARSVDFLGATGRALSGVGEYAGALAQDIGHGDIGLGGRPFVPRFIAGPEAKIESGKEGAFEKGVVEMGKMAPLIAGGMALGAAGVPSPLAFGYLTASQAAAEGGTTGEIIQAGAVGAAIPESGHIGKDVAVKLLTGAIDSGLLSARRTVAQKAVESLASQGGMQLFMAGLDFPAYAQMNPDERMKAIKENAIKNSAWFLMEIPGFMPGRPSQTQVEMPATTRAATAMREAVDNPTTLRALQEHVDNAVRQQPHWRMQGTVAGGAGETRNIPVQESVYINPIRQNPLPYVLPEPGELGVIPAFEPATPATQTQGKSDATIIRQEERPGQYPGATQGAAVPADQAEVRSQEGQLAGGGNRVEPVAQEAQAPVPGQVAVAQPVGPTGAAVRMTQVSAADPVKPAEVATPSAPAAKPMTAADKMAIAGRFAANHSREAYDAIGLGNIMSWDLARQNALDQGMKLKAYFEISDKYDNVLDEVAAMKNEARAQLFDIRELAKPIESAQPAEPAKPRTLTTALLVGEDLAYGIGTHADILKQNLKRFPSESEYDKAMRKSLEDAFADDSKHVFVDEAGAIVDRSRGAEIFQEITGKPPEKEGELHSKDLIDAKLQKEAPVKEAKIAGEGSGEPAPVVPAPPTPTPIIQKVSKLRKVPLQKPSEMTPAQLQAELPQLRNEQAIAKKNLDNSFGNPSEGSRWGKAVKKLRDRIREVKRQMTKRGVKEVYETTEEGKKRINEDDGILIDLLGVGKIPVFQPSIQFLRDYEKALLKKRQKGILTQKDKEVLNSLPVNFEDDYGGINDKKTFKTGDVLGTIANNAYQAAKAAGVDKQLFVVVKDNFSNAKVDWIVNQLSKTERTVGVEGKAYNFPGASELFSAIENESIAKSARNKQRIREIEQERIAESQYYDFTKALAETENTVAPTEKDLVEGNTFTLSGEKFRVESVHRDENDRIISVRLKDGGKFGDQTIYFEEGSKGLRMDAGSLSKPSTPKLRTGEKGTAEMFQEADAPFNLAVEKTVDGERVAAEKLAAEQRRKEAAEIEKKKQQDLFGQPAPAVGPVAEAKAKPEAIAPQAEGKVSPEQQSMLDAAAAVEPVKGLTAAESALFPGIMEKVDSNQKLSKKETAIFKKWQQQESAKPEGERPGVKLGDEEMYAAPDKLGIAVAPEKRISTVTQEINGFLGTKELPGRITVVHEPEAPFGAIIYGRDRITINSARIAEGDTIAKLLEEGMHGVWKEPELQAVIKQLVSEVRKADIARERLSRRGLDVRKAILTEEAAIARALESPRMFSRLWNTIKRVFAKLFGVDLPSTDEARQMVKDAARKFLSGESISGAEMLEVSKQYATPSEGTRDKKQKLAATQVSPFGKAGVFRPVESMSEGQKRAKLVFNGDDAVNDLNTRNFWNLFENLTNPEIRRSWAPDIAQNIGGDMGLGLLMTEMKRYAVRAALGGDPAMLRSTVQRAQDFQIVNTESQTALGGTGVGRALASLRSSENRMLFEPILKYAKEQSELVKKRLGVGPERLDNIIAAIDGLVARTTMDVGGLEKAIREGRLQEILDLSSPEKIQATEIVDGSTFVKPEGRDTILETVYQWLKTTAPIESKDTFIKTLVEELTSDRQGRARLTEEQAQVIADQTWNRKANSVSERAKKLLDSELNRLDRLPAATVEGFMRRFSQSEWLKPESPNNVRDLIKKALRWRPGKGESVEPIIATRGGIQSDLLKSMVSDLTAKLVAEGVPESTARRLAEEVYEKRQNDLASATRNAMNAAAESTNLKSLIESLRTSPYLAQNDPAWRLETAENWFKANGISPVYAKQAALEFDKKFVAALEKSLRTIAEQLLERAPGGPRTVNEMVEAVRSGLMDPEKTWMDELSKFEGFKPLTKEEFKRLAELEQKYSDPNLPIHIKVQTSEQMMGIFRHVGGRQGKLMQTLGESFAASLLSGIKTATLQVFQPWITMAVQSGTHALFSYRDFPTMAKMLMHSAGMYGSELKFALKSDSYSIASDEQVFHSNNLKRVWEQAQMDWKAASDTKSELTGAERAKLYSKSVLGFAFGWQQYVIRTMQAADQAGMVMARHWKMALYGSMAMRAAGLNTKQISQMVDCSRATKKFWIWQSLEAGYSQNDANVIGNEKAHESLRRFFDNDLRGLKKGMSAIDVEEAALYDSLLLTGRRAKGVDEKGEGMLSRYMGVNWAMRKATEARMEGGAASIMTIMAVGFMNVPLRTARYYAGFSPYGLLRQGVDRWRTNRGMDTLWEQSHHNSMQSQARLREAIVGTALALGFFAWQKTHSTADDDAEKKDFALFVTGMGPTNRTLRDAWMKRGFQPFTLHVVAGGKVVSQIPVTRAGQVFGFPMGFAAAVDDLAWRRKQEVATGKTNKEFGGREAAAIAGTYYQIVGAQGVFQAAGRMSQISQGEVGPGRFVAMQGASLASGLIPGKSLVHGMQDILYGPVDRSSIEASVIANFPVLSAFVNGKAINRLGDVIGENTWEAKTSKLGFPVLFRVSDNPENKAIYQLLLETGASPPDLRRSIVEEKYGPMSQDDWGRFVKASGSKLKELLTDNLSGLKTMQPQEVKSFMNAAGDAANTEAASQLGMQMLSGSGGGGESGGSGGRASASYLPRTPKIGAAAGISAPAATSALASYSRSAGTATGGAASAGMVSAGRRISYGRRLGVGGGIGEGRASRSRTVGLRPRKLVSGKLRTSGMRSSRRIGTSRPRKARKLAYRR